MEQDLKQQIRKARSKFAAMAGAYSLGVFNDQFFKQAACLLAIAAGLDYVQGWVIFVFTIPYLVFAAWSLWTVKRTDSTRLGAVALFTCFLVAFVILTYFATIHRGPNWDFYWSSSQSPEA